MYTKFHMRFLLILFVGVTIGCSGSLLANDKLLNEKSTFEPTLKKVKFTVHIIPKTKDIDFDNLSIHLGYTYWKKYHIAPYFEQLEVVTPNSKGINEFEIKKYHAFAIRVMAKDCEKPILLGEKYFNSSQLVDDPNIKIEIEDKKCK